MCIMPSFHGKLLGCLCYTVLLAVLLPMAAQKPAVPRFKWGQNKDQIYLSVMVRDLDHATVTVALPSAGEFNFRAKDKHGEEFALNLELREDVQHGQLKWEIPARPDKWGTAVLCTLNKVNEHRWDMLVTEPKKFKDKMHKDWTREDQKLEPEDEVPYVEQHSDYLMTLTGKNEKKTMDKFKLVVVNVRYPWCSQCRSQDDAFAKAAKAVKAKRKRDAAWKHIGFVVLDAREERSLARTLGAKCDDNCEYKVFTGLGENPAPLKATWNEDELLDDLVKFLVPAAQGTKAAAILDATK